jgi:antitoxin VapB
MEERRIMATVLNIKDAETHALAQELAALEHKSLTQAVKDALREKLARERDQRGGLAARLMAIGEECSKLPVLDPRTPDEIIGYDEFGSFK